MESEFEHHQKNPKAVASSISASIRDVSENEATGWDKKSTARLLRKLDLNIIPFMSLVYLCVSFS